MRILIHFISILLISNLIFAQSIVIGNGASVEVQAGADICAGVYGNITGNLFGTGTQCGEDTIQTFQMLVKFFLEGPYSGGSMSTALNTGGYIPLIQPFNTAPWNYGGTEMATTIPAGVVDWVLLELRSDFTTQVARRAAFLKSDGLLVDMNGTSQLSFAGVPTDDYYVVIYHRNHLAVMTANTVNLSSNPILYDLTIAETQAYGTNAMKNLGGGYYGVYASDANGDGTINATDLNIYWIPQNGTPYDYNSKTADFNLDGTINATDLNVYWIPNNGRATQVPAPVDSPVIKELIGRANKD